MFNSKFMNSRGITRAGCRNRTVASCPKLGGFLKFPDIRAADCSRSRPNSRPCVVTPKVGDPGFAHRGVHGDLCRLEPIYQPLSYILRAKPLPRRPFSMAGEALARSRSQAATSEALSWTASATRSMGGRGRAGSIRPAVMMSGVIPRHALEVGPTRNFPRTQSSGANKRRRHQIARLRTSF
jgi:hypothetical protein